MPPQRYRGSLKTRPRMPAGQCSAEWSKGTFSACRRIGGLEITNALLQGVHHSRISEATVTQFLQQLRDVRREHEFELTAFSCTEVIRLAQRYKLSAYDASYLELARRRSVPLATLDEQLRAAASHSGVTLL